MKYQKTLKKKKKRLLNSFPEPKWVMCSIYHTENILIMNSSKPKQFSDLLFQLLFKLQKSQIYKRGLALKKDRRQKDKTKKNQVKVVLRHHLDRDISLFMMCGEQLVFSSVKKKWSKTRRLNLLQNGGSPSEEQLTRPFLSMCRSVDISFYTHLPCLTVYHPSFEPSPPATVERSEENGS